MNNIEEVVDLPPVESKAVLHPLDVASARQPYLVSWCLGRVASLPVAFLFGVVLWVVSDNVVTPILVPLVVLIAAAFARRYFAARAWGYIPRKRQDHRREHRAVAQLAASFVDALAVVSGLLLLVAWLSDRGVSHNVAAFAVGSGVGIALLQLTEVVAAAARRPRRRVAVASRVLALAAVALAVLFASVTLIGDGWSTASVAVASIGGGAMIIVQVAWWLVRFVGARPKAEGDEQ